MRFRCLSLAVVPLLVFAPALDAQVARGQVVDSLTGEPVGSGFVVLVDADGAELSRSLTTAGGHFAISLPAGHPGPFRLRSERIGFAAATSDPFGSSIAGDPDLTLRVRALPRQLAIIEVRAKSECENRMRTGEPTTVVWEEIRKALVATSWSNNGQFRFVSNMYERVYDDRHLSVLNEHFRPSIGLSAAPFISRDPSLLVEGVLWIDRASFELRSLEYQYTNLPYDFRTNVVADGTVEFTRLASGAWIVHGWRITIPTVRSERLSPFHGNTRRFRTVVDNFRDVGGEVLSATDAGGGMVYQAELAEVVGMVVDSSDGQPTYDPRERSHPLLEAHPAQLSHRRRWPARAAFLTTGIARVSA